MDTEKIYVIVVDDQEDHNSATRPMLAHYPTIVVLGSARNDKEMYKLIQAHSKSLNVILLDVEIPGDYSKDGTEIATEILNNSRLKQIKILCLSVNTQMHVLRLLLKKIGVHGYLDKHEVDGNELVEGIRSVHEGGGSMPFVNVGLRKKMKQIFEHNELEIGIDLLTRRERQIVPFIAQGLSNEEVCHKLFENDLSDRLISTKTADVHRGNIYQKLDCSNAAQVAEVYFNRMRLHGDSIDELPNFKKE
jgi:DNA-binding NarL/FixJ family response regulator